MQFEHRLVIGHKSGRSLANLGISEKSVRFLEAILG